jgi:predicted nicotinamide N-methyase
MQRLRVLELGCGHGLPGVLCLLAGSEVHFQDYNREVLTSLTAPNVAANLARLPRGAVRPRARYFAGEPGSWAVLWV